MKNTITKTLSVLLLGASASYAMETEATAREISAHRAQLNGQNRATTAFPSNTTADQTPEPRIAKVLTSEISKFDTKLGEAKIVWDKTKFKEVKISTNAPSHKKWFSDEELEMYKEMLRKLKGTDLYANKFIDAISNPGDAFSAKTVWERIVSDVKKQINFSSKNRTIDKVYSDGICLLISYAKALRHVSSIFFTDEEKAALKVSQLERKVPVIYQIDLLRVSEQLLSLAETLAHKGNMTNLLNCCDRQKQSTAEKIAIVRARIEDVRHAAAVSRERDKKVEKAERSRNEQGKAQKILKEKEKEAEFAKAVEQAEQEKRRLKNRAKAEKKREKEARKEKQKEKEKYNKGGKRKK